MKWLGVGNLGMLLLGIWLVLTGLIPLVNITFANMGSIMAVLAIAAGGLILLAVKATQARRASEGDRVQSLACASG